MFTPSLPPTALMSLYNVQCLPLAGTLTTRCAKVRIVILANLKDNLHISGNIRICSKERRHLQISLYFKLQFKIVIDMNIHIATHIPGIAVTTAINIIMCARMAQEWRKACLVVNSCGEIGLCTPRRSKHHTCVVFHSSVVCGWRKACARSCATHTPLKCGFLHLGGVWVAQGLHKVLRTPHTTKVWFFTL